MKLPKYIEEKREKWRGFLNPPMDYEFEHQDPLGPRGMVRKMLFVSLSFLFAMMFYMRSCYPDMERSCDIICEASGHDYGEVNGAFFSSSCYCYDKGVRDIFVERPLTLP